MYIPQKQLANLENAAKPGKVAVLYGARRVGKTTLLKKYLESFRGEALFVNGDDIVVRQYLESQSIEKLREFVGNRPLLVVDEAQYVRQIGLNLKLIIDHMPSIRVIPTGSSSFDLAKDIGEPLAGRKYVLKLFPLAQMEISHIEKPHETKSRLESRLIYGSYPEVVLMAGNSDREILTPAVKSSSTVTEVS